jgi:NAD(P) transhydrogenase subunit beta
MNANLAAILYLVSGVLFILALRGLSSPTTSQAGNRYGMIGMAIAVGTTLWLLGPNLDALTVGLIVGGVAAAFAAVNIFGGFLVTQRMLAMYKKKEKK